MVSSARNFSFYSRVQDAAHLQGFLAKICLAANSPAVAQQVIHFPQKRIFRICFTVPNVIQRCHSARHASDGKIFRAGAFDQNKPLLKFDNINIATQTCTINLIVRRDYNISFSNKLCDIQDQQPI
jgi:hypothetical protein